MARKKSEIQPLRPDIPLYPIGVAARLLNVHPRTLRIYEDEGLIKPAHSGSRRMFSENDVQWVRCLRSLIHEEGISIPGLKKLLALAPCWEIAGCPGEINACCSARVDWACPRSLHQVSNPQAVVAAKAADSDRRQAAVEKKKQQSSG